MPGHDPLQLSVSQSAELLLHHAARTPTLSRRTAANSNDLLSILGQGNATLPFPLRVPSRIAVPQQPDPLAVRCTAEHAIRAVTDAACQAEHAARLAGDARRAARRGTIVAACFGTLAALFAIAVAAAIHINTRANAEVASVSTALHRLDATQRQINDRLTALHTQPVTQAALVAPDRPVPATRLAPAAAPPVSGPAIRPIGPALPVAIKPLPPVTWSMPGEALPRRQLHVPQPDLAMATAAAGSSG